VLAWTGREVLVVGGAVEAGDGTSLDLEQPGAAYDPAADAWRALPAPPLEPRRSMAWAWTGRELVVWGGIGRLGVLADGAAYDPAADAWRTLPPSPLSPRSGAGAVWTGAELLVLGGSDLAGGLADGAAYDPAADRWRAIAPAPRLPGSPAGFLLYGGGPVTAWTGTVAVTVPVYSGFDEPGQEGVPLLAYDPAADAWSDLPALGGDLQVLALAGDDGDLVVVTTDFTGSGPRPRAHRLAAGAPGWERDEDVGDPLDVTSTAYDPAARRMWTAGVRPAATGVVAYDLADRRWWRVPPRPAAGVPADPVFGSVTAVWVGAELIVLEGATGDPLQVSRFRPAAP